MNEKTTKEQHKKLLDLHNKAESQLGSIMRSMYKSGNVDRVPHTEKLNEISEGWSTRKVEQSDEYDIWTLNGNKKAELPQHSHKDKTEVILVLSGSCKLYIITEDGVEECIHLHQFDSMPIPSETKHRLIATEDVKLISVFRPPLTDFSFKPKNHHGSIA